jgi:hypothetical protein
MSREQQTIIGNLFQVKDKAEKERNDAEKSLNESKIELIQLQADIDKLELVLGQHEERGKILEDALSEIKLKYEKLNVKYSHISGRVNLISFGLAIFIGLLAYAFAITKFPFGFMNMQAQMAALVVGVAVGGSALTIIQLLFRYNV